MQWGESETSPSLGVINFKIILVLGRHVPASAAVVVLLVLFRYCIVQCVVLLRKYWTRRDAVG
jgi:hypothetical protein